MTTTCIDCNCTTDYGGRKLDCKCGCHKNEGRGLII